MTPPKEHSNFPVTSLKEMETWHLHNAEFKITVFQNLSELQENLDNSMKSGKKI